MKNEKIEKINREICDIVYSKNACSNKNANRVFDLLVKKAEIKENENKRK